MTEANERSETRQAGRPVKPRPSQPSILIVDDEPVVRALSRRILEEAGFRVFEAEDGVDALRVLGLAGPFHAVVSDVRMPNMDGHALASHLALLTPPVPTLLISGYDGHADGGFVLMKPFEPEVLLDHVRRLIGRPRERGRRSS
jgi:CheY-like chemotaxis protein